ncbi:MAG TPA: hypothetical protein GXZ90_09890 [Clostridiales bacterium]|nr:hypothetical protein [Clostridiales bacterium]
MKMYKYNVDYNANFWGSRKNSGYVFADSMEDARLKLENKYGKVDYTNLYQSSIISFKIYEIVCANSDNIIEITGKADIKDLVETIGFLIMKNVK